MKKLSKAQQAVLDLMNDGWELGWGLDFHGRCWIQKGGVGFGGESKDISSATAYALRRDGHIVCVENKFPAARYHVA